MNRDRESFAAPNLLLGLLLALPFWAVIIVLMLILWMAFGGG